MPSTDYAQWKQHMGLPPPGQGFHRAGPGHTRPVPGCQACADERRYQELTSVGYSHEQTVHAIAGDPPGRHHVPAWPVSASARASGPQPGQEPPHADQPAGSRT